VSATIAQLNLADRHSTKDAIALKSQKHKNAVHAALSPNPQIRPVIRNTEDIDPHIVTTGNNSACIFQFHPPLRRAAADVNAHPLAKAGGYGPIYVTF
jgi:carbamoylphosphate synthase small subunit